MKQGIHPKYETLKSAVLAVTRSKRVQPAQKIFTDVCSECHPFYTGKQRVMDTGGRVDKFKKRFGALGKKDS